MPRTVRTEDLLDLMETLLQAQLDTIQEIRRIRTAEDDVDFLGKAPRRTYVEIAQEVLEAAGGPLHIGEIAKRVREAYGVFLTRETLASAISRQIKLGKRFVKAGPNMYDVLERSQP